MEGISVSLVLTEMHNHNGGAGIIWDTGLGKSHLAMVVATFLMGEGLIDHTIVVCERVKMGEWVDDFHQFTALQAMKHHGPGREKRLKESNHAVTVTTYETGRTDFGKLIQEPNKRGKTMVDGWMLDHFRGARVLIVFDEATKLKNRSSQTHRVWAHATKQMRKAAGVRTIALSATPFETGPDDVFNVRRICQPVGLPTIAEYEKTFLRGRDPFGRPQYHKGLLPLFHQEYVRPWIHRKRKTDEDVIAQFPKMTEQSLKFDLPPDTLKFYEAVEALGWDDETGEPVDVPGLYTVLRQIAGYPEAITRSPGALATMLTEEFGRDYICALPSVKAEALVEHAGVITEQGAKLVVFSFFGQSIVPLLTRDLEKHKIKVFTNHGGLTEAVADAARKAFRAWEGPAVLVSSDAGSKGLNLPEATYVTNYELPTLHTSYIQRINRCSRIVGGKDKILTVQSYIALGTVEESRAETMMTRNEDADIVLGDDTYDDERFVSAADRRAALGIARNRKRTKRR
jgi:SNF2 family DNA or RNA helicase